MLIIAPVWLAGCGGGDGGGPNTADGVGGGGSDSATRVIVALGPQSGGGIEFLRLDSLAIARTGLVLPGETRSIHDAPSANRLVALTGESLLLFRKDGSGEVVRVDVPGLTGDVVVRPAAGRLLLLDRGASRLHEVDPGTGRVTLLRTFARRPEEIFYDSGGDRIVVVMRKGNRGVVSALPRGDGESMTVDLDAVVCSAGVGEKGLFYMATEGEDGARLKAYRIGDLTRTVDVGLEAPPDAMVHPARSGRVYLHYPADGLVVAHDVDGGGVVSEIPTGTPGGGVLVADDVGARVYLVHDRDGRVTVISTDGDRIVGEIEGQDGATTLVATPGSRYIILRDREGMRIRLYDGGNLQLLRVFMEETPMAIALLQEPGRAEGEADVWAAVEPGPAVTAPSAEEVPSAPAAGSEPVSVVRTPEPAEARPAVFTLQLFSSDDPAASETVLDRLIASGIPSFIEEAAVTGQGRWYRVRAGGFSDREDAEAIGGYIHGLLGLDFWVVALDDPASIDRVGLEGLLPGQDMDGDGFPEIAVVGADGVVRLFSLHGSRFVRRWTWELPADQALCGAITYADSNGDGVPEALLPLCPLEDRYVVMWDGAGFTGMMPM
jgi:cell division septation protein DedD